MNRKIIVGIFIASFIAAFAYKSFQEVQPKEIENAPDWMPLQAAQTQAVDDNKLIVVDIYEVGCQYCRAMHEEIYPSPTIRTILDRDFYPVQINGHSENTVVYQGEEITEAEFASRMGVTAYPFTVILDGEGNVLDSRRGYMDVVSFSRFLKGSVEMES